MATFRVLRRHDGDKPYFEGDTREMSEVDAKHLVALGVLERAEPAKKAESEPEAPKPSRKRKG